MHKKRPKICTCCRVSEAKFYLYHSTKIAKARPGFDDRPEYSSVQINSSSPWFRTQISGFLLFFPNLIMAKLLLYVFGSTKNTKPIRKNIQEFFDIP